MAELPITTYIKVRGQKGESEHHYRTALENLLNQLLGFWKIKNNIKHEKSHGKDEPDFTMVHEDDELIGLVECKKPDTPLEPEIEGEQLHKYNKKISKNIILTDYWKFILFDDKKIVYKAELSDKPTKEQRNSLECLIRTWMDVKPPEISSSKQLATSLAWRCSNLKVAIANILPNDQSNLSELYRKFKEAIYSNIDHDQFADAIAQTITYALFMAKLNAGKEKVELATATEQIPQSLELISEIIGLLPVLKKGSAYAPIRRIVESIVVVVNCINVELLRKSMSFERHKHEGIDDDPYIYFYATFLSQYDPKLRERRGVYYTPPKVVKFIVRAVDDILKRDFKLPNGLAEHKVTALDFATGTGTFLQQMMQLILESESPASRDIIAHKHILKNFYGFELLIAPYVIAHLKLSQYLTDMNVALSDDDRLQVFLTNTLDYADKNDGVQESFDFMPALKKEFDKANQIKDKNILVVIGNPPYSGHSENKGTWISSLINDYKKLDGKPLNEKNSKWLQDDYVKFIRFAQRKIEHRGSGIVAIITNHAFLDNPTFRGMRQSLMNTFDQMYFLDLHGNIKKQSKAPDGNKDENVFDIQQGVAISLLVKKSGLERGVFHADFWGTRDTKYERCNTQVIEDINWQKITPITPHYLFVPRDESELANYNRYQSIVDIFDNYSVGIVTARDKFTLDFDRDNLRKRVQQFVEMHPEQAREHFDLGEDSRDWKVVLAQTDLLNSKLNENNFHQIAYRPFDTRQTYYTGNSRGFHCMPRRNTMRHIILDANIGLVTVRQVAEDTFSHAFVTDKITDFRITLSNRGGAYFFPFSCYYTPTGVKLPGPVENFKPEFRKWIDEYYGMRHTAQDIFNCIYTILHSPNYRQRYAEFLRIDFPRIPFPEDYDEFKRLAKIGNQLIEAHINPARCNGNVKLGGNNTSHIVSKVEYKPHENRLYFNPDEYLENISPEVYDLQIGGYKPLDKFLKERKGRNISNDIDKLIHIANAIAFTIKKMTEIDNPLS